MKLRERFDANRTWLLPLGAVLAAGAALRAWAFAGFWPVYTAHLSSPDAALFVRSAATELYSDPTRPAGYPLFLRAIGTVTHEISVTVGIQHLLGLLAAGLVFAAVRAVGAPVAAALVPAAVVALNGDMVFIEHTILSEALFVALISGALWLALRTIDRPSLLACAGIGVLLGAATLTRSVGLGLVPAVALWLLLAFGAPLPRRALAAGTVLLVGVAMIAGDSALRSATSEFSGAAPNQGRSLYSRVANFADCTKFEPPAGTRVLCEATPPDQRPNPDVYLWGPTSPAGRAFGKPPAGNEHTLAFARAAIRSQPLDYAEAVIVDLARFVTVKGVGTEDVPGAEVMAFSEKPAAYRRRTARQLERWFGPLDPGPRGTLGEALAGYQRVVRGHGLLILAGFGLAIAGLVAGDRRTRLAILLLAGVAIELLLFPAASLAYGSRYALPALGPLADAAALAVWVLLSRRTARPPGSPSG